MATKNNQKKIKIQEKDQKENKKVSQKRTQNKERLQVKRKGPE